MIEVRVYIANKDRRVGAMIKALAVEIAGFTAVTGTKKNFFKIMGIMNFIFPMIIRRKISEKLLQGILIVLLLR